MANEPVNKLSVPCITSFSPSNFTACLIGTYWALLEFLSKNWTAKSKNSGRFLNLGIGAVNVNSSGLKLVSVAGISSTLPKNSSPASTAIWSLVSLFTTTSFLKFGVNGILTTPKSISSPTSESFGDSILITPLSFLMGSPNKCILPTA